MEYKNAIQWCLDQAEWRCSWFWTENRRTICSVCQPKVDRIHQLVVQLAQAHARSTARHKECLLYWSAQLGRRLSQEALQSFRQSAILEYEVEDFWGDNDLTWRSFYKLCKHLTWDKQHGDRKWDQETLSSTNGPNFWTSKRDISLAGRERYAHPLGRSAPTGCLWHTEVLIVAVPATKWK